MKDNPFLSNGIELPLNQDEARRIAAGLALEVLESHLERAMERFARGLDIEDQVMLVEATREVKLRFLERFFDSRSRQMLSPDPREGTAEDPLVPYLRELLAMGESIHPGWLMRRMNLSFKRASALEALLKSERGG